MSVPSHLLVAVRNVEGVFQDYWEWYNFSENFRKSVAHFVDAIGPNAAVEAMKNACERMKDPEDATRYFCGICWERWRYSNLRSDDVPSFEPVPEPPKFEGYNPHPLTSLPPLPRPDVRQTAGRSEDAGE